jgi:hypothetical protein
MQIQALRALATKTQVYSPTTQAAQYATGTTVTFNRTDYVDVQSGAAYVPQAGDFLVAVIARWSETWDDTISPPLYGGTDPANPPAGWTVDAGGNYYQNPANWAWGVEGVTRTATGTTDDNVTFQDAYLASGYCVAAVLCFTGITGSQPDSYTDPGGVFTLQPSFWQGGSAGTAQPSGWSAGVIVYPSCLTVYSYFTALKYAEQPSTYSYGPTGASLIWNSTRGLVIYGETQPQFSLRNYENIVNNKALNWTKLSATIDGTSNYLRNMNPPDPTKRRVNNQRPAAITRSTW